MGQDRVRPLALALQGLDYTVRGQTAGGGREGVFGAHGPVGRACGSRGGKHREGDGGCSGCSREGEEGGTGVKPNLPAGGKDRRRWGGGGLDEYPC